MTDHAALVRQEFARQLPHFERDDSFFADDQLATWVLAQLEPLDRNMVVLEVACGAAHQSEVVAPRVRQVVGIDLTPDLLGAGAARLARAGVTNVLLQEGEAGRLPFLDASFDLVFCRFAVHHFDEPLGRLAEMVRVCRPGGRVVVIDMISPDAELAEVQNHWERRRDPSHTMALGSEALAGGLVDAGAAITRRIRRETPMHVERWLSTAHTPAEVAEEIRAAFRADLSGGVTTGCRPVEIDGELHFRHTWEIVVAVKEGRPGE
ncbi:MAG: methyltransferase domain-containing protein [Acidimicrobiia bacterium]|nr:methyltransferase domain-containing protein [Acidimicrobiia bacterium]